MTVTDDEYLIGKCGVRKTVRDCDRTLAFAQMVELFKDSVLGDWVKRSGRFIENHILAILEVRTGKSYKLPLTARKVFAVVCIVTSKNAVISVLPILDNLACAADIASFFQLFIIEPLIEVRERNDLAER